MQVCPFNGSTILVPLGEAITGLVYSLCYIILCFSVLISVPQTVLLTVVSFSTLSPRFLYSFFLKP